MDKKDILFNRAARLFHLSLLPLIQKMRFDLPSSTRCFRGYFSSNGLENKWIYPISYPFISLKAFHFPYSL